MIPWFLAALMALSCAGIAWYVAGGVKIKAGWQNGASPSHGGSMRVGGGGLMNNSPEALATMTNALRAGFSISQAFASVVERGEKPMSEEFAILIRQMQVGMSFEEALESMNTRVGSDDLALVTTALLISRKTGGNVTEIFDKISETIRGRMKIERKVHTLTAQGRLQGIIVSIMPFFLGAIMVVLKPNTMIPFLTSAAGMISVALVIVLVLAGWLIIRKIVKINV